METVQHAQAIQDVQTYEIKAPVHEMMMCSTAPEPELVEEEIDIDLNDPEVEQAAIKIQAGFKGMRDRAAVREKKQVEDLAIYNSRIPQEGKTNARDLRSKPGLVTDSAS